jgi:putative ABC transport system substrate-binding protein
MNLRRRLLFAVVGSAVTRVAPSREMPGRAVDRIAYLDVETDGAMQAFERFKSECERLRHDRMLPFEFKFWAVDPTGNDADRSVDETVAAMIESRPQIAVATFLMVARSVARHAPSFPVIFHSSQTYRAALAERPSLIGNPRMTGVMSTIPLSSKRLELLRSVVPNATRVGLLTDNSWWTDNAAGEDDVNVAAAAMSMRVTTLEVRTIPEFDNALQRRAREFDAWLVPRLSVTVHEARALCDLLNRTRKPAIYSLSRMVRAGGLMSYEAAIEDIVESAARQTVAILGGTPVDRVPIEYPRHFRLAVNLGTARTLGLRLPVGLLKRADLVVTI